MIAHRVRKKITAMIFDLQQSCPMANTYMNEFAALGTVVGVDVAVPVAEGKQKSIWLISAVGVILFDARRRDLPTRVRDVWTHVQGMHQEIWPGVQMNPHMKIKMHSELADFQWHQTLGQVDFVFWF